MKEVFDEIFAPIIKYFEGIKFLNKGDHFIQNIVNERFGLRDLTKITLGAILLSTIIGILATEIINDESLVFSVVDIPLLNELIITGIFYLFSSFNAWIVVGLIKPNCKYPELFLYTFLATTTVVMISLPIANFTEFFVKLFVSERNYFTIEQGVSYGVIFGQISGMAGVLDKLYGVEKKKILWRLLLVNLGLGLIFGGLLIFFLL